MCAHIQQVQGDFRENNFAGAVADSGGNDLVTLHNCKGELILSSQFAAFKDLLAFKLNGAGGIIIVGHYEAICRIAADYTGIQRIGGHFFLDSIGVVTGRKIVEGEGLRPCQIGLARFIGAGFSLEFHNADPFTVTKEPYAEGFRMHNFSALDGIEIVLAVLFGQLLFVIRLVPYLGDSQVDYVLFPADDDGTVAADAAAVAAGVVARNDHLA